MEEIFRRAVFNVAAANDDDHGRNHAFLMDASGTWTLAPACDVTLATYPLASGFRAARVMGKSGGITRGNLRQLGEGQGVRRVDRIIDEVLDARADWPRHGEKHDLPKSITARVAQEHGQEK